MSEPPVLELIKQADRAKPGTHQSLHQTRGDSVRAFKALAEELSTSRRDISNLGPLCLNQDLTVPTRRRACDPIEVDLAGIPGAS